MIRALLTAIFACFALTLTAEQTLIMIKPEQIKENHGGAILNKIEKSGLKIVALKMTQLSSEKAAEFYISLKDRSFYPELIKYMSSGPIVAATLQGDSAIEDARTIIGATDPAKAAPGTIRHEFGHNIQQNAIHGSDSPTAAAREISFFFPPSEIYS